MSEISAALAVGKEVVTHTDNVSVPGWSGAGYIILDPETGEGAYKISGGSNGGYFTLLMVAAFSILAIIVTAGGLLVAPIFVYLLLAVAILTTVLTLIYGPDFTTYRAEIEHVGLSAAFGPFIIFIRVAQFLGAVNVAREMTVVALAANAAFTEKIYTDNK